MKKYITILYLMVCSIMLTYAQPKREVDFSRNYLSISWPIANILPDKYTRGIVFNYGGEDTLTLVIILPNYEEQAYVDSVFLKNGLKSKSKVFDLSFMADRLVLKKDYPSVILPVSPKLTSMYSNRQVDSTVMYKLRRIETYTDSTILYLMNSGKDPKSDVFWGRPAKYLGDITSLEAEIARRVKKLTKHTKIDSTIVFEAVVNRPDKVPYDKVLAIGRLMYGKPSPFSDIVKDVFFMTEFTLDEQGEPKWRAAYFYHFARVKESRIKIYAHLTKEGTVQIELPKSIYNFSGD